MGGGFAQFPQQLTEQCFSQIAVWLYEKTGISLTSQKRMLVSSRLMQRLRVLQLNSFEEYLGRIVSDSAEAQIAINLLTTNETYFFREEAHFKLLESLVKNNVLPRNLSVWSAACSSGEEAYSIAFTLARCLGLQTGWSVDASDINTDVLELAQRGVYPLSKAARVPADMLRQYCLKGTGADKGLFQIDSVVRQKIRFYCWNLLQSGDGREKYDVIFLRNVFIYFDRNVKVKVLGNLRRQLKPNGFFMIGHAESIQGIVPGIESVQPGCYQVI